MTDNDPTNDAPDPAENYTDDFFAAAGGASSPDADNVSSPDGRGHHPTPEHPPSPYPDGPGPAPAEPTHAPLLADDPYPAGPPAPYPAGDPYPAGPPAPYPAGPGYQGNEPQFGRRAPTGSQRPDADGYYPSEYYVGPDWMRIIVSGLAAVVIVIAAVAGGTWLWEEFGPDANEDEAIVEATPTPLPLVLVYECAGDAQPVTEMLAPPAALIAGRTADSRWLAFRNPQAPPLQLWVRATSVPDFPALDVGVMSCATSPDQFPTSGAVPTPVPTIAADPTPSPTP